MRISVCRRLLLPVASTLILGAGLALAQDATGKITGNVTDPSGSVIAAARVTVTNVATRVSKQTLSDSQGYYQMLQLPIGRYEVAAEAPGFSRTVVQGKNSLEINQTLRIDVTLEVGSVKDTVTVEGGDNVRGNGQRDSRRDGQRAIDH